MIKAILFFSVLLSMQTAKADKATGKLFLENNGMVYVGRNTVTNSECTVYFKETSLYYSFEDGFTPEEVTAYFEDSNAVKRLDSISAAHFYKKYFSNTVVAGTGGPLSFNCLLTGNCSQNELKLVFDSKSRPEKLIHITEENGPTPEDICQF